MLQPLKRVSIEIKRESDSRKACPRRKLHEEIWLNDSDEGNERKGWQ